MYIVLLVLCLGLLCLDATPEHFRRKRIVGGEPASPPPPGASESEDVVENPALVSERPTTTTTRATTARTTIRAPVYNDDGPIVFLRRGRREARVKGKSDPEGINAFNGIRYAEPPVGSLRFQRPRRTKLQGDIDATKPGLPCPQTLGQRLIGSEDCLFLNVFSPKDSNTKKYPVIFWIHGGGFRRGSGSQYGVANLVKKGLVVVTIQYRLGSLGFLSANRKELPGNAGLFDIASALRWVRHYIQFFGGDPSHIIPSGQGSGGSAAVMLTLAHFTQDWIKGVFSMSGTAISPFAVDSQAGRTAEEVSSIDHCQSIAETLAFVRCMQKLPLETVVRGDDKLQETRLSGDEKAAQKYINSISKLLNPGPAVEGEDDMRFLPNFLIAPPLDILQKGSFADIPLLTGVTKQETSTSAKGGGLASLLLKPLEITEEVLEGVIPQLLNVNTGIFGKSNPAVDQLFSQTKYLKGITSSLSPGASALDKLIEMTTDTLFNLPAFLTSQLWSKQNRAFLYSFEHPTKTSAADDFLQENPLTDQRGGDVEEVGHGDDLIYLFDVLSVEGEPVAGRALQSDEDLQVREHFTNLVAEFARSGVPKVNGRNLAPFTMEGGDYAVINGTPSVARGFRKCQMGLWAGLSDLLKSTECSFLQLGDLVNGLGGGLLDATRGATNVLTKPTSNLVGGLKNTTGTLTGLLGGNKGGTQKPLLGFG